MANIKITELPAKADPNPNDLIPLVDVSVDPPATKQATVGSLAAFGATGPAGVTGATGVAGVTGATGASGVSGATGPVGAQGSTGATGVAGPTGALGATGVRGATGSTGPAGVGFTPSGNYSALGSYDLNDVVTFNGASYARADAPNVADRSPADYPELWTLLADRGVTGATGARGATGPRGLPADGGSSVYEFTVNYTGTAPSAVADLPTGWSASIAGNDVTITHNLNQTVKNVTYWGYTASTDLWHARYPTASSELTTTEDTKTTAFKIRISTTVVACDTGGTARIVCFF